MLTLSSRLITPDDGDDGSAARSTPEPAAQSLPTALTHGNWLAVGLRAAGTQTSLSNCVLRDSEGSKMGLGL